MSRRSKYSTLDDEVDNINKEITELLSKGLQNVTSEQSICNNDNWIENLDALSEELGLLGINLDTSSSKETDNCIMTVALCNAMWPLVHRYKKLNEKCTNSELKIGRIQQDNECLQKSNKNFKSIIEDKEYKITSLKSACLKLKSESDYANKEIIQLKSLLEKQRKQQLSKDIQRQKEVKRSEVQLNSLQDKFRGQCGQFTSRDKCEGKTILELKKNEEKYKQIINRYEENQDKLLHEILSLKEDIVVLTFEKNTKDTD